MQRCEGRAFSGQSAEEVLHGARRVEVLAFVPEGIEVVPRLAHLAVRWGENGDGDGGGGGDGICRSFFDPTDLFRGDLRGIFVRLVRLVAGAGHYEVEHFKDTHVLVVCIIWLVIHVRTIRVRIIQLRILVSISAGYYPALLKVVEV